MNRTRLSDLISSYAMKRLTAHEVDPEVSNGHEFQGVNSLRKVLGSERLTKPCSFLWLPDDDSPPQEPVEASVSWYDSREKDASRSAEWRLYYDAKAGQLIQAVAHPDDLFVLARFHNSALVGFIVAAGSTYERQLLHLLGAGTAELKFQVGEVDQNREIGLVEEMILELLGLESPEPDIPGAAEVAERLFGEYRGAFPSTEEFSRQARASFQGASAIDDPDGYLVGMMEWETALFRLFEERLVSMRLESGFARPEGGHDVEAFIAFSRSIGNRRFSRAGYAFEHHVRAVLEMHGIRFGWHVRTEGKRTPDFLFPGRAEYHDATFPNNSLRMLGVKTSCKDRWRQVISEAARIKAKHLLTLEPGISEDQTSEMKEENVVLVIPRPIHETYTADQRGQLVTMAGFIRDMKMLQEAEPTPARLF